MKKLLTLGVALLTSFSLWAVDPTFESSNWADGDFATLIADHDGITLTTDASAFKGNFVGTQYIALGGGCDLTNPSNYLGIKSAEVIDSIEVFWTPNGTSNTSIAWAAWTDAANLLAQDVDSIGKTDTYKAAKNLESAIWQKIDLTGKNAKAVLLTRQLKKAKLNGVQQSNLGDNQTVNVLGIRVWTQESKEVDHVEVTLNGVAVNGDEIESPEVDPLFYGSHTLNLTREFVEAPTVTFIKQTDTYYVGEATPSTKNDSIHVVATGLTPITWEASYTLNTVTYTVSAIKPATATVTYMDGETVLGTETVKKGEPATKYGEYQVYPLTVFAGWYMDAELTNPVDMATFAVNNDLTVHGWFVKSYAESVNFENNVMNNGKSFDIIGLLGTSGYATDITGSLDSLDNSKTDGLRNYAYLGLKVKQNGATLNFWIGNGSTVKIKFGNIAKTPLVSINGGEYADMSITDKVYTHTATAVNELISIKMADASAVVFQQIMIDEELRSPELFAINCAEATNGTVAASYKLGIPNETITLTVTPDAGYKIASVTVNSDELVDVEGAYSFTMPGQDVDVVATFEVSTGVSDAEADADAKTTTKRLVDGVLLIEKDGVTYSAQGGILK